jgi:hypothetical protein
MDAANINITAESEVLANAISVAVSQGLSQAGFTNVTSVTEVLEPDSLLAEVRNTAPELFDTAIEITQNAIIPNEETDDDEGPTADDVPADDVPDVA